jgi:NAD+ diphosphatase
MVGFVADYAGGQINADQSEIVDAGWFTADNLPSIPPRITIARHLIDWFVESHLPSRARLGMTRIFPPEAGQG